MDAKLFSVFHRDALKDDTIFNIEAYYLKDWQGYDMPMHSHNQMEIMYVLGGSCGIPTDNGSINLKKNEFIFLDAGVPHGLKVEPDAVCRMMNIEFTLARREGGLSLRSVAGSYPPFKRFLSDAPPRLVFIDTEDIQANLRRIIKCLDAAGEGWQFEFELLSAELIMAISRLYCEGSVRNAADTHVRRAIQYMNQNYYREIGVGDVSAHVGIAPAYLSRVFRRSVGESMVEYLTELRIKKAKMLLGKTELPVVEISGYVGVPSRAYFNELFRKHTGLTPGEYRKASKQEAPNANPGCI